MPPTHCTGTCFLENKIKGFHVKPQDTANIRSTELHALLGIEDLDLILKERRLRWYGHVERSNCAVKTAFDIQIVGKRGPGRPKMTWKQLTERDCREWKLSAIDPHDRDTWRSGVRSAMCEHPSYLEGAHCCGYCPCTCTFIKNPMMMMMMMMMMMITIRWYIAFSFNT